MNYKIIFLYSTLIVSTQIEHGAYAHATFELEVASTVFVEGAKDSAQMTCETLTQLTQNHLSDTGDMAKETVSTLGPEAVENVAPDLDALKAINTIVTLCLLSKDVKSYLWPSQEEIAHAMEVNEKYESLVAKKAFKECLLKKIHTEKNSSGIPCACEGPAQLYAMMAGIQKTNDIKEVYKHFFNEREHAKNNATSAA